MKLQIGIIGPEEKNMPTSSRDKILSCAKAVGRALAERDVILITGGCTGVVEAAIQGAKQVNGLVVGTPGRTRGTSVSGVDVEICTPIDIGDYLFAGVPSCDSIIVFPGDAGTIAELAIAYRYKTPLIFIKAVGGVDLLPQLFGSFKGTYPLLVADNPQAAAELAISAAKQSLQKELKASNRMEVAV